ncbi:Transthyretin-like protein 46 [Parelaphostrongylus tenuis]|uniref:Transthyretin-like protein 46 n=1 Tax=Parelaphostrongylus tenuis TaxID=148309 RepID=A0AAD5MPM7_PARTN|nr:Transthyretin-like protein 46 [Parelaphostrongylus tenuis]
MTHQAIHPTGVTELAPDLSGRISSFASIQRESFCVEQKPANNVRVKLWDEDDGLDPDDELDAGYTNGNGEFSLSGGTAELTPIDPVLKVYHDCDDAVKPGSRKVKFYLPKSYITEGRIAKKTFDIGVLNLETIFPGEERELVVSRRRRDFDFLFDD